MANASSLTPENRFMALFVGDSGSGKTPAACSWFHEGRVLDFDFDGRIRGLLGCPWIDRTKVDYNSYPPVSKTVSTSFDRLNKDLEALSIQSQCGQLPYKTLVLDSLSTQTWSFLKDGVSLTKGNTIGPLKMAGPQDFNFESSGTKDVISFFKSLPGINVILTAHLIDKYGPVDPDDPYKGNTVVGQKLSLRDKLAAEIPGGFDHVFEFDRYMIGDEPRFRMRFWSDIARTTFQGMPRGWQDITGKDFYVFMHDCIKKGLGQPEQKVVGVAK